MSGKLHRWSLALALSVWQLAALPPPPPPGPPGPPPPPPPPLRLQDVREHLLRAKPVNPVAQEALDASRECLRRADEAHARGDKFRQDRLTEAADAGVRIAEHQQHMREGARPPGGRNEIKRHLEHVYFRTRQADFFAKTAGKDKLAQQLHSWATEFYQSAVRAMDRGDLTAADEEAKCADDAVRMLECLAQESLARP